jgi:predicted AlkP superfamily phosphohydrolase/phosphomutase
MSVFDIAPTILHLYGLPPSQDMKGRVLMEIFEDSVQKRN